MEIFIYKNFNLLNIYCSFYNTNSISLDLYYNYIQVPLGIDLHFLHVNISVDASIFTLYYQK